MGFFYIQSAETALVLDVSERNRSASTPVIMYAYKGSSNQLWYFSNHVLYSKLNGYVHLSYSVLYRRGTFLLVALHASYSEIDF
jgi:hypothetical protein